MTTQTLKDETFKIRVGTVQYRMDCSVFLRGSKVIEIDIAGLMDSTSK